VFNIIYCAGAILGSVAFFGLRKNYYSALGLLAFIFTMIIIWVVLAGFLLSHIALSMIYYWAEMGMIEELLYFSFSSLPIMADNLSLAGIVLRGVMFIFWGLALIVNRNATGRKELTLIAGIFAFIVGILEVIHANMYFTELFFWLLTIPAEVWLVFNIILGLLVIATGITGLILLLIADVPKGEQVITSRVRFLPVSSRRRRSSVFDDDDDW
jgi:hypothetical protein